MNYFEHLETKKTDIIKQLDKLFVLYNVEPVGNGFIDCIVMKDKLEDFINELSIIGLLITDVSWWCYVNLDSAGASGCPHGMGGPKSEYYDGWFSELQNDLYDVDRNRVDSIISFYNKELVSLTNANTLKVIEDLLKEPFKYTPTEYIEGNKCVMPGLWLLVPNDWKRG